MPDQEWRVRGEGKGKRRGGEGEGREEVRRERRMKGGMWEWGGMQRKEYEGVVVVRGGERLRASTIQWTEGKECHLYVCVCKPYVYAAPHVTRPRSALYANRLYLSLYRKYNADRLSGAGEGRPRIVGELSLSHSSIAVLMTDRCTVCLSTLPPGDVQVHPSAQVHPTAVLGPNVYVGSGVVIRPGVRVRESIILDRAELKV